MTYATWRYAALVLPSIFADRSQDSPHVSTRPLPVATSPEPDPPPSAGHALVYHDSLRMVLLLNAGLGAEDDSLRIHHPTFIWGWRARRWNLIDSSGPPVRNLAGVAYDSRRNVVVIHGGTSAAVRGFSETWEWGNGRWTNRGTTGPGPRDHTAMAYDPVRARAVLFGGQTGMDSFPNDTWEWDGTIWSRVSRSGPPPRVHHAMQYDPVSRRVLVFAGYQANVRDLGDVWAWDGQRWEAIGNGPARTHAVMAFHGRMGAMAAIGGMSNRGPSPVLSLWRNGSWVVPDGFAPPPRYLPGAAYDSNRGVLVLFGGGPTGGHGLLADTWEHDGTRWTRIAD